MKDAAHPAYSKFINSQLMEELSKCIHMEFFVA